MNDLLAERAAKRKPASNSATINKPTAEVSPDSAVSKGKKSNSKRQAAKESPKKTNSPARLGPKNKSKKESPKSTNQKRGIGSTNSRTRIDSPMAKISIDDEKENKRSSPRKRNRDSSSGSQSSSSQSSQVYIHRKFHPRIASPNSPTLLFCCNQKRTTTELLKLAQIAYSLYRLYDIGVIYPIIRLGFPLISPHSSQCIFQYWRAGFIL